MGFAAFLDRLRRQPPSRRAVLVVRDAPPTAPGALRVDLVGDSHALRFDGVQDPPVRLAGGREVSLKIIATRGGTLRGFGRRRSFANVRERSRAALRRDADVVVFALGQVDCEFGYLFRHVVAGKAEPFESFAADTIEPFVTSLAAVVPGRTPLVQGVNPPSFASREIEVALASEILASSGEASASSLEGPVRRALATLPAFGERAQTFNAQLRAACEARGIAYFDLWPELVDPTTGRVWRDLTLPRNHHMRRGERLYGAMRSGLTRALQRVTVPSSKADTLVGQPGGDHRP